MKIAVACQSFNRTTNGVGVFAVQLAIGLAQAGHELLVMTPAGSSFNRRELQAAGIHLAEIKSFSLAPFYPDVYATPFPSRQIGSLLDSFRPDIVHTHDHYPLCREAIAQARQRGLPILATNHFLPDNMILNVRLFELLHRLVTPILWKTVLDVINQADAVSTATETSANILRDAGVHRPVFAISCGVDQTRFYPDPLVDFEQMRRRYGIDPRKIAFLYVGRLENEKRIDCLIKAVARYGRKDIQLVVAGKGVQEKRLKKLCDRLGLSERVLFTGFVPEQDLPGLLNSADFFAMPGDTELQSIATLEAMSCGLPVLAADARALPELVRHQQNGYLFQRNDVQDAAQGIDWLVGHLEDWQKLSDASLEIVKPHDVRNTVTRYEKLYRSLLPSLRVNRDIAPEKLQKLTNPHPGPAGKRRNKERLDHRPSDVRLRDHPPGESKRE